MAKERSRERASELRERAEIILSKDPQAIRTIVLTDVQELIHELNVHQIELEMQNTELRRVQLELQEAWGKYLDLYDLAPTGYFTLDCNSLIVDANLAGSELLGSEKHRLLGAQFTASISPDSQDAFYFHYREVLKTGIKGSCELKMLKADGTSFHAQLISIAVPEKDGNINHCRTAVIDITERKRAEKALRESEYTLQLQMERMPIACIIWSPEFRAMSWNPAAEKIFGFSKKEALGKHPYDFIVPKSAQPNVDIIWTRLLEGDSTAHSENDNLTKDGRTILCHWTNTPLKDDNGTTIGVLSMAEDITERKKLETVVKSSEERFRALVENSSDIIAVINGNGIISYESPSLERILGYKPEERVGKNVLELETIHPDDILNITDAFITCIKNPGKPVSLQVRFMNKDGSWRVMEGTGCSLLDNPSVQGIVVNYRDITERKKVEEALRKLDRMKSEFIATVSHELRTPLQSIMGFTKLLVQGKAPDSITQTRFLDIIDKQSERLAELIGDLLDVSRLEAGKFVLKRQRLSLGDTIRSAIYEMSTLIKEKAIIIVDNIPEGLPEIEADEGRINQVILNLVGNAIKFSSEGGKVTVNAQATHNEITVQIIDQGIGIPAENLPNLFQKFHQINGSATRTRGGLGLGLYITRQIVEAHGGQIWVESKVNQGSTFSFTLPLTVAPGEPMIIS